MPTTRRSYLVAVGAAAAVGTTAGCLGGGGSASALPDGCDVGELDVVSSLPRPALGPEDAAVTVDVFEDYACPHCQTFTQDVYPEIRSKYIDPGEIRYRFFDFPIPVDVRRSDLRVHVFGERLAVRAREILEHVYGDCGVFGTECRAG